MKRALLSIAASAVLGVAMQVAPTVARAEFTVPTEDCGLGPTNTCLKFGDFTVYSLPLLNYYQLNTPPLVAGVSSPDNLAGLDLVVKPNEATVRIISTNAQGTAMQGLGTLIDDPFDARTGAGNDNLQMLMLSATFGGQFAVPSDPAGGPGTRDNLLQSSTTVNSTSTFTTTQASDLGDSNDYSGNCFNNLNGCLTLWDADISALRTALNGGDAVFFFRNNETGDSGTLQGQDLDAWMRVCVSNSTTLAKQCFTLNGTGPDVNGFASDAQMAGVDDILPDANEKWAHVHSDLCVEDGTGQIFAGKCQTIGKQGTTLNQSLGQNTATYAMFNAQLSALINDANSGYDVLTVDGRISHANDGGDILWITSTTAPHLAPEPATLALVGFALAGLGLSTRRRRSA